MAYDYTPPTNTNIDFQMLKYGKQNNTELNFKLNPEIQLEAFRDTLRRYNFGDIYKTDSELGEIRLFVDGSVVFSTNSSSIEVVDIDSVELDRNGSVKTLKADFTADGDANPSFTTFERKVSINPGKRTVKDALKEEELEPLVEVPQLSGLNEDGDGDSTYDETFIVDLKDFTFLKFNGVFEVDPDSTGNVEIDINGDNILGLRSEGASVDSFTKDIDIREYGNDAELRLRVSGGGPNSYDGGHLETSTVFKRRL